MAFYQSDFTLGILGGGQLGRMLIQSCVNLNVRTAVLDPDAQAPCRDLATSFQQGSLQDFDTVYQFGKKVNLLTIEIEHVNVNALERLEAEGVQVFPQPHVIRTIQDKRLQKEFYKAHGIPTADFVLIDTKEQLVDHEGFLPAFQKLGKGGYDGGGVQKIASKDDFHKAFEAPSLLEKFVDFEKELSVITARNANGDIQVYPVVELVFDPRYNLVDYLISPASISKEVEQKATSIARKVAESFGIVGLLAVELFLTKDGEVLVNEVAPRPHNSGHQTINANITSQYEQHLRAICNLPLGSSQITVPSAMVNLLGEDGYHGTAVYEGLHETLAIEGVHVFLYGKAVTKPHRKMGHVTIVDANVHQLKEKVETVKHLLKVIA